MLGNLVDIGVNIAYDSPYIEQSNRFDLEEAHIEPQQLWFWDNKKDEDKTDDQP